MRIRYTARAIADLERLRGAIAQRHDRAAARRASARLLERLELLAERPDSGRPLADSPVRQWVMSDYLVRYQILNREIIVVRLWHRREDLMKSMRQSPPMPKRTRPEACARGDRNVAAGRRR